MREEALRTLRAVIETPSRVYQRHHPAWDRAILSAGWVGLYLTCDVSMSTYPALEGTPLPAPWRALVAALLFVAGLWQPAASYLGFMLAMAYPVYLVSPYLAILGASALLLSAPLVARAEWETPGDGRRGTRSGTGGFSMALLVLASPLLTQVGLAPLLPLVAGLWWGTAPGAATGVLAALWLKMCAGMAGHSLDLGTLHRWRMSLAPVYARFHAAGALQTVAELVAPFWSGPAGTGGVEMGPTVTLPLASWGPGVQHLLFHALQVGAWGMAGYLVGAIRRWLAGQGVRAPLRSLGVALKWSALSLGPGLLALWAGDAGVPAWLQRADVAGLGSAARVGPLLLAGLAAWGVDAVVRYLGQPVAAKDGRRRAMQGRKKRSPAAGEGIIMLELD